MLSKVDAVWQSILEQHNHSWYEDILMRNKERENKISMYYRGTTYTYKEFFEMVESYSRALKAYGLEKGDEFVACIMQTPDYPVLVAAASLIGAKINLINSAFDLDYIVEIIDRASADIVIVCEWDYVKISPALCRLHNKTIIVLPMDYWIKGDNPYKSIEEKYFPFDRDRFHQEVSKYENVVFLKDFLNRGLDYKGEINGHGKLEDDIAITYTSGSTKKGVHKGIVQKNRTYIIMGRYHDPGVAGIPSMKNTWSMVFVGTHADTTLMSGVSDTLLQGGIVALEPIIEQEFFVHSLIINRPGLVVATRTYWIYAMKETYSNPEFKNLKLPYMYVPSEGGEPLSAGEEIALNKWLRKVRAGVKITHTPFSIVKMTIGGGDSEHGSLFLSLYRGYKNPIQKVRGISEPIGLAYYKFAEVQALREDGTYCDFMEIGHLVANSPASMERYHNDPEATEKYFITDAYGKKWGDLSTYGYIDKWKNVYIKGRIGNDDPELKTFQIADVIQRDARNIMSCEVLFFKEKGVYVAHIEFQYRVKNEGEKLKAAKQRCIREFGKDVSDTILFRVRTHEEGFPTLFTAKRNLISLRDEGTSGCIENL